MGMLTFGKKSSAKNLGFFVFKLAKQRKNKKHASKAFALSSENYSKPSRIHMASFFVHRTHPNLSQFPHPAQWHKVQKPFAERKSTTNTKLQNKVPTLYRHGSCSITQGLFESFGQQKICVIEQVLVPSLKGGNPFLPLCGHRLVRDVFMTAEL